MMTMDGQTILMKFRLFLEPVGEDENGAIQLGNWVVWWKMRGLSAQRNDGYCRLEWCDHRFIRGWMWWSCIQLTSSVLRECRPIIRYFLSYLLNCFQRKLIMMYVFICHEKLNILLNWYSHESKFVKNSINENLSIMILCYELVDYLLAKFEDDAKIVAFSI